MTAYMVVNDIHLSDRAPSSCTDSYLSDLFTLLEQTITLAHDRECGGVIWAGDVFHHKTPGRTSHSTVMSVLHVAESYPCPLYVVPGNHDLTHDRLDSIDETQPLGVLFTSGLAQMLNGWARRAPVYGVPWLQRYDLDSVNDALADYVTGDGLRSAAPHRMVVTHAPLYPPGQELPYEFFLAEDWATAMGGSGTVHYGHVHEPHGVYTVGGVTFSNCGALSRGSLHEYNLTRPVQVAVWDDETGQIEHVTVPHRPANEVFRLQDVEQVRTAQVELDRFLESVGQTRLAITSTEAVLAHVRQLDLAPAVVAAITELLDQPV